MNVYLFILLIQQIIVHRAVTQGILSADIRSRNGIDQAAVDRTYQISGSRIHRVISPVLRSCGRLFSLSGSGALSARLIRRIGSGICSVTVILGIPVFRFLCILIRNLDLFLCQFLNLLFRQPLLLDYYHHLLQHKISECMRKSL